MYVSVRGKKTERMCACVYLCSCVYAEKCSKQKHATLAVVCAIFGCVPCCVVLLLDRWMDGFVTIHSYDIHELTHSHTHKHTRIHHIEKKKYCIQNVSLCFLFNRGYNNTFVEM